MFKHHRKHKKLGKLQNCPLERTMRTIAFDTKPRRNLLDPAIMLRPAFAWHIGPKPACGRLLPRNRPASGDGTARQLTA